MTKLLSRLSLAATVCAALFSAPVAFADIVTATFTVSASVTKSCTITATNIALGSYDPIAGIAKSGTGTVHVACTKGTAYTVALSTTADTTGKSGQMKSGTDSLPYNLFSDTGCSTPWASQAGTGTRAGKDITVCAQIPANTDAAPGTYQDTVTATISY